MNDDWRLQVTGDEIAHKVSERLGMADLEHDLEKAFADRVVVSLDGPDLFCYAGTRDQAELAQKLVEKLAAEHKWELSVELTHWHPTAEEWEDPDTPLPETDDARATEHAELIASERAEEAAQGYPEWEVRVQSDSHRHAEELADTLAAQGLPSLRRYRYLLLGALDEDSAAQLAEQVRGLAPAGTTVTVEGSGRAAWNERPGNPFAILGGLAG